MLNDERIVTFSEAAKVLPRLNGRRIHPSTVWRWARKGIRGVYLESRCIGSRFVTSIEAIERFSKQLAELDVGESTARVCEPRRGPELPSDASRQKMIREADSELTQAGI